MNVVRAKPPRPGRQPAHRPKLRVLVASHSHPEVTSGGAEIAAFRLFSELDARDDTEAWFLGCNTRPGAGRDGVALTQPFGDRDYVYSTHGHFNWFRMSNADPRLPGEIEALLLELRPDVVHLHHYVVFGVELLWIIKRVLPQARIILTLHEYLTICHHFGQMVKTGHFSLCDGASLDGCHKCFPDIDVSDFFLRDQYLRWFLRHADHFIAPSRFLADRYAAWGLPRERISVIENIIAPPAPCPDPSAPPADDSGPLRIGFFGQISKLKGISVLLGCAAILAKRPKVKIKFEIYGDYRNQPKELGEEFQRQLATSSGNVTYHGTYRQDQVDRLMRGVDAVLVPSIWWENSPVVIQEALRNHRPVICSDIGGMAEKVRNGVDGLHFSVGSEIELGNLLLRLHDDRSILVGLRQTLQPPPKAADVVALHLAVYAQAARVTAR